MAITLDEILMATGRDSIPVGSGKGRPAKDLKKFAEELEMLMADPNLASSPSLARALDNKIRQYRKLTHSAMTNLPSSKSLADQTMLGAAVRNADRVATRPAPLTGATGLDVAVSQAKPAGEYVTPYKTFKPNYETPYKTFSPTKKVDDLVEYKSPYKTFSPTGSIDDIVKIPTSKAAKTAAKVADEVGEAAAKSGLFGKLAKAGKKNKLLLGAALVGGGLAALNGGGEEEQVNQEAPKAPAPVVKRSPLDALVDMIGPSAAAMLEDSRRYRREADTRGRNTRAVLQDYINE